MTDPDPVVLTDVSDRIATIILNRPEVRNALNRRLMAAVWDAVRSAGDSDDVDVVILTGADPAFCAGIDLREVGDEASRSALTRPPGEGPERTANGLFRFLPVIDKPVIGAINGACVTGGFELALQCNFLIASERARFADTHARVGVMPGGGVTALSTQAMGLRRALELSLTGNFIGPDEALRLGLVNHVVTHDELLPFARRIAGDIVSNDQQGVRRLVQHYRRIAHAATLDEAHLAEGLMAETWAPGISRVAERTEAVIARGQSQVTGVDLE